MKFVVFIAETYVQLVVTDLRAILLALSVCSHLRLATNCLLCSAALLPINSLVLCCMIPFIATCVDAIGMVFWDRQVLCYPGKALILVAKLLFLL